MGLNRAVVGRWDGAWPSRTSPFDGLSADRVWRRPRNQIDFASPLHRLAPSLNTAQLQRNSPCAPTYCIGGGIYSRIHSLARGDTQHAVGSGHIIEWTSLI
jgi:hypothetical protein